MFYFYLNFPTFNSDPIKIHRSNCGFCQNGSGRNGGFSNQRGFWAGPFEEYAEIESALVQLNQKFTNPPSFENASCCNPNS